MNILLTHSYYLHFDRKEHKAMMPYVPLGTLYAASVLRGAGFPVSIHDTMFEKNEGTLAAALERRRPNVVVIYDDQFNYLTKMCLSRMREAAFRMAHIAHDAGATVVVFSSDAGDRAQEYLSHHVDYVILGEAEHTLLELCQALQHRRAIAEINGLAFRDGGTLRTTPSRPLMHNLDELPFPAWDLIPLDEYRRRWRQRHGYWSLNIVTTRGCPYHCNWCAKPIYGQVYHSRSPQNVVDEMIFLRDHVQPDHLWFADDIFGLKPGWIEEFAERLETAGFSIPFKCLSRADLLLKGNTVALLRNSGCETVWLGAESGSQHILNAMEKGTTVAQIRAARTLLAKHGLRAGFFLQFGYPGEIAEDIDKTLQLVKELVPDEIGVSVSYPLPGTKFYEQVQSQLGTKTNWRESQDLDLMFAGTYRPEYYRMLHRVVHKRFSIWRGLRSSRDVLRHPSSIGQRSIRSFASMLFHGLTLPVAVARLRQFQIEGPRATIA